MENGFIYQATCKVTGKSYIGQAKEYKTKLGKPFRYGIKGRWSDHLSAAKAGATTPLADAIRKYGPNAFELVQIQYAPLVELDAFEALWIDEMKTLVPGGYNVCAHSRNRHRTISSLAMHYQGRVQSAVIRPVRTDGKYKLVYAMLTLSSDEVERVVFGQKEEETFEVAKEQAIEFLKEVGCPYTEETSNSQDPLERYASKLREFENKCISRIRITTASSLIAVYVTTSEAKSYKDQVRICFGGKTVPNDVAYELALQFVKALPKNETTILEDQIRSRQQVAAVTVETEP